MKVKIGCDIVKIERIKKLDSKTLNKIFHKTELKNKPETLAGIFAAKESVKKVFNDLNWHDIEVIKEKSGRPSLIINKEFESCDLSISHDGDYAIASVVFMMRK